MISHPANDRLLDRAAVLWAERGRADRDDDCALPPPPENDCRRPDDPPLPLLLANGGSYTRQTAYSDRLPGDFRLVAAPDAGPVVLGQQAWERWHAFDSPAPLGTTTDRQLARLGLLRPVDAARSAARPLPPGELTAWLHVTNACNLDCPYCYVRKSSARMSPETGTAAVEAAFRAAVRGGFDAVRLKYAGGESSLHLRLVRRLHERAAALAVETGLPLREVMLTNGVHLRPADADWLAEIGMRVVVSLDGVGALHNRLRPMAGRPNEDTFARVAHTIDRVLLPRGLRPDITMTVTGLNAHGAADVARWAILERNLPTRFSFYRANPFSRGRRELALEEEAIISGMLAAYDELEADPPDWPFTRGLLDRADTVPHAHACGVGLNYLVFTHTGAVSQCQMHLDHPVHPGTDGDLSAAVAAGPILNLHVEEKEGCRDCDFRFACAGGCPLETFRVTGRFDVRSPNCRIYQSLLPHVWRLEGLRLLRHHGYPIRAD